MQNRISKADAERILKMAIEKDSDNKDSLSEDEFYEIGKEAGISRESLDEAAQDYFNKKDNELRKESYLKKRKALFFSHLAIYTIVNAGLFVVDHLTSPGIQWAYWPLMGWGSGLAMDFWDSFFLSDEQVESRAHKYDSMKSKIKSKNGKY